MTKEQQNDVISEISDAMLMLSRGKAPTPKQVKIIQLIQAAPDLLQAARALLLAFDLGQNLKIDITALREAVYKAEGK